MTCEKMEYQTEVFFFNLSFKKIINVHVKFEQMDFFQI